LVLPFLFLLIILLFLTLLVVLNDLVNFLYSSSCTDFIINVNAIFCHSIFVRSLIERLVEFLLLMSVGFFIIKINPEFFEGRLEH
jgi:hypothetical protein